MQTFVGLLFAGTVLLTLTEGYIEPAVEHIGDTLASVDYDYQR